MVARQETHRADVPLRHIGAIRGDSIGQGRDPDEVSRERAGEKSGTRVRYPSFHSPIYPRCHMR